MSRLDARLAQCRAEDRAALIPFITAGDPAPEHTLGLMRALVAGGADVLELGVPFSDPMADGPVIQLACERALSAGTRLSTVLEIVRQFREGDAQTPVVLMGYLNPMLRQGAAAFAAAAAEAGVDGVLAVDLAVEEAEALTPFLSEHSLASIFLMAPTTSLERAQAMNEAGSGYLYYVSLKGVTGSGALDIAAVEQRLTQLRSVVSLPLAVGFGVREASQAAALGRFADGVVVGSALVECIANAAEAGGDLLAQLPQDLSARIKALREGVDGARSG